MELKKLLIPLAIAVAHPREYKAPLGPKLASYTEDPCYKETRQETADGVRERVNADIAALTAYQRKVCESNDDQLLPPRPIGKLEKKASDGRVCIEYIPPKGAICEKATYFEK